MNSQYQHAYCQVSGTPFEQGVQQGQELSDAIRRNLASVHRKLAQGTHCAEGSPIWTWGRARPGFCSVVHTSRSSTTQRVVETVVAGTPSWG